MFCWVEIVFIFVFNYKSWYLSMGESIVLSARVFECYGSSFKFVLR